MELYHKMTETLKGKTAPDVSLRYDLGEQFHDLPITYLASGHFSTVWLTPIQDEVLKISHRTDDGGRLYARFCHEHPSPHAPEIRELVEINGFMFIRMKRYTPIDDSDYDSLMRMSRILNGLVQPDPTIELECYLHHLYQQFRDYPKDLHCENVMLDEHNRYIITDPISYNAKRVGYSDV